MEEARLLSLPEGFRVDRIQITPQGLLIEVIASAKTACCPVCGETSSSVHCHYQRSLRDVPCAGRPVQLRLTVRKFTCRNPYCQQKVFAERLPDFAEPFARMTLRYGQQIASIGLATCGKGGARLAARLGIRTTRQAILRRIMALPDFPAESILFLGIDDFCATRSCMSSCKDSGKEDLTWSSASSAEPSLNQERLGQCSHIRKGGNRTVRGGCDC